MSYYEYMKNKIGRAYIRVKYKNGLSQDLNGGGSGEPLTVPEIVPVSRKAAADGIVLLKNDGVLPLDSSKEVAVFGRCALDYFCVGYGSGGDIRFPYKVNLMQGLANADVKYNEGLAKIYEEWTSKKYNKADEGYWGNWPTNFDEMPLSEMLVENVAAESETAIIVIGRAAGEDRESKLAPGSYYLTTKERKMIDMVTKHFNKTVIVLDCGNLIDMSWVKTYDKKISAILYAWQGGMESGNALTDVLVGKVNPSAHLTDTIAINYEDYPSAPNFGGEVYNNYYEDIFVGYRYFETFEKDKVLYPFGYGLSYTDFSMSAEVESSGTKYTVKVSVTNRGKVAGRQVCFIYVASPDGPMGMPARVLAGFKKTKLLQPKEKEELVLELDLKDTAGFDDRGVTGHRNCFVLDPGEYKICLGGDVRAARTVGKIVLAETVVAKETQEAMGLPESKCFKRLVNKNGKKAVSKVPHGTVYLKERILDNLPKDIPYTGDKGINLADVATGKNTLEEFVAQLSPEELEDVTNGYGPMNSEYGPEGNAGSFGGNNDALIAKGIKPIVTTDGPSGIRLKKTCSLNPCGTALASSFDLEQVAELYSYIAKEMKVYGSDLLLAPGMNIHRNPLCGRNFEYYSEDPVVSGLTAAAVIKGLRREGVEGCPKHFAANNQETKRNTNDSRVSKRALREVYLKGFEIMIKEAKPAVIMASYNKINGVWSHYNYDLHTTILRGDWGYDGLVITDWWMHVDSSKEFPAINNNAYRVRSQVDVVMPGCDGYLKFMIVGRTLRDTYGQPEGITLGEMQRSAINVLNYILRTKYND